MLKLCGGRRGLLKSKCKQGCIPVDLGCVLPALSVGAAIPPLVASPFVARPPSPRRQTPPAGKPPPSRMNMGPANQTESDIIYPMENTCDQRVRQKVTLYTSPVNRITDRCKNIAFPQLRRRVVIIGNLNTLYPSEICNLPVF